VAYVWVDALINYLTASGAIDPAAEPGEQGFDDVSGSWWPADLHLMGKDIITTHAVYWPTLLMGVGLPVPRQILAHGWWVVGDTKMSKSLGNVVDPLALRDEFGTDAVRWYLMREMPTGQDASYTPERFLIRYEELANVLGNLASRTTGMLGKYRNGVVPDAPGASLDAAVEEALATARSSMEAFKVHDALGAAMDLARSHDRPVVVDDQREAVEVIAGADLACARIRGGSVRCWGANESGQLGNGTTMGSVTPVDVMLTDVTDLETGSLFTCSLTNVPALHCWGFNEYDQLGPTSDATIEPSPVEVPTSLDVLGFAAGDAHVCAVDSEFRVTCWGRNDRGQLGRGAAGDPQAMPQRLSSLSNIVTVSAGVRFTCAGRQTDMSAPVVHCWGDNAEGQLGNRTRGGFQAEPQQVMLAPP